MKNAILFIWKIRIIEVRDFIQLLHPRKVYNYFMYGVWGTGIKIDASTVCQLRCPACPTVYSKSKELFEKTIGKGFLKFDNFKKLIDKNPWIKRIELSNWGEIFLNSELQQIIEYGSKKKIIFYANVNLNRIEEDVIICMVKNNFRYLSISIDGASNETYPIYRQKGNFDKVIANIKKINYYKQKYNTKFPKLSWQFVVFGHNEHELPAARKLANELNMKFVPKLITVDEGWNPEFSPVKDENFVRKNSGFGVTSRKEFEQKYKRHYNQLCAQMWTEPQITWDGKLLGCCNNMFGDFGNVFEEGLSNLLKQGEKFQYAKKMLIGKMPARKDIACTHCPRYKQRKYRMFPKIFEWIR